MNTVTINADSWTIHARQALTNSQLRQELECWFEKKTRGLYLYLFIEGATISDLDYASQENIEQLKLECLQIVRLFCTDFELYARRMSFENDGRWQLRTATSLEQLPADSLLKQESTRSLSSTNKKIGQIQLLGKQPERFRRIVFKYPGIDDPTTALLEFNQFQIADQPEIVCWTGIASEESPQENNSNSTGGQIS